MCQSFFCQPHGCFWAWLTGDLISKSRRKRLWNLAESELPSIVTSSTRARPDAGHLLASRIMTLEPRVNLRTLGQCTTGVQSYLLSLLPYMPARLNSEKPSHAFTRPKWNPW